MIRKCIFHISNEGIFELIEQQRANAKEEEKSNEKKSLSIGGGFVELLIRVLTLVFESGETNIDGKEQSLMVLFLHTFYSTFTLFLDY